MGSYGPLDAGGPGLWYCDDIDRRGLNGLEFKVLDPPTAAEFSPGFEMGIFEPPFGQLIARPVACGTCPGEAVSLGPITLHSVSSVAITWEWFSPSVRMRLMTGSIGLVVGATGGAADIT